MGEVHSFSAQRFCQMRSCRPEFVECGSFAYGSFRQKSCNAIKRAHRLAGFVSGNSSSDKLHGTEGLVLTGFLEAQ